MHKNAELMFAKYAVPLFLQGDRVIEMGPSRNNTLFRDMLPARCEYHYADVRTLDLGPGRVNMPAAYQIDAPDGSFDVVFSGQVLEHVAKPWLWVPELARVARRAVVILAPVSYEYHPGPLDCWRVFADGMRVLLEDAGLRVVLAKHETLDGRQTDVIGIGEKQ